MTRTTTDLEPIDPRTAQQLYLDHKGTECTDATVQNHRQHTKWLVRWCDETGMENLNELTGRDLQEFRLWRKEQGDINLMTLNNFMSAIRVFLKWAGSVEAVRPNLHEKVMVPQVSPADEQADAMLEADKAEKILKYLEKYHYASDGHVLFALLWETGMRIGAARSISKTSIPSKNIYG